MNIAKFGGLRSPVDVRDWVAEQIYASTDLSLITSLDLRSDLGPVRDQGLQGSCVAQSIACMKEWQEKKEAKFKGYMSPQFIYNNRINQSEEGMYIRNALTIIKDIGSCRETTYRYGTIESKDRISQTAIDEAANYRIVSYAQATTIEGVKVSLHKKGPCVVLFPCYNFNKDFWIPEFEDQDESGHAVAIVGYDENGFIIRNSWGVFWGDDGYTRYPYEQFGAHWEIWTTIDGNSKEVPSGGCCNLL